MANTRISFIKSARRGLSSVVDIRNSVTETIAGNGVSSNTAPSLIDREAGIVRVHAEADIWVNIGSPAVSTAGTGLFMKAGEVTDIAVIPGNSVSVLEE